MHTQAHIQAWVHACSGLPILRPALWGWHVLSPTPWARTAEGPTLQWPFLPDPGAETQVGGSAQEASGMSAGAEGAPNRGGSVHRGPTEVARPDVLEPTRLQAGGTCCLALAEPG